MRRASLPASVQYEDALKNLLLLLMAACCAAPAVAHRVIAIADGDTLTVLRDRTPLKVRLADIDAPEKRQPFGFRARQTLSDLCFGKDAALEIRNRDRYGRVVARVRCDGIDANRALVERGMAWHYARYSKDRSLDLIQLQAMSARRGLWADPSPVPPWTYRRAKKGQHESVGSSAHAALTPPIQFRPIAPVRPH